MTPEPVEKCKLQIATTMQPSSNEKNPCRAAVFADSVAQLSLAEVSVAHVLEES